MAYANQARLALSADAATRLLTGWRRGTGSTSSRLAGALRAAIDRGELLPETRLPPERDLARALDVGRGTVAAAYGALLRAETIERRQGSGSWVRTPAVGNGGGELASRSPHRLASLVGADDKGAINLQPASFAMPPGLDDLLAEAGRELARVSRGHGYLPQGYAPLRRAIAARLSERGLPTTEDEILVTTGAQQAIALTAMVLVRPGEFVLLEDPTFPGAIDAYQFVGARLLAVPVTTNGMDIGAAADALDRVEARVVYVTPSFQNPTGTLMPTDARQHLLALAQRHDAVIVEDDTFGELAFGTTRLPPIARFDRDGRVVLVGSLSKIFWGGLRVGWIRASRHLLGRLGHAKGVIDLASSLPSQALATAMLRHGHELRRRRIEEARAGLAALADLLAKHLPSWTYTAPAGGLVLWVKLPQGSATEFARMARQHGVAILPGTAVSPSNAGDDRIRIPFSASRTELADAMPRLARAWHAYERSPSARTRVLV
jgi:DNA-binding transcriptional MocR family regulator